MVQITYAVLWVEVCNSVECWQWDLITQNCSQLSKTPNLQVSVREVTQSAWTDTQFCSSGFNCCLIDLKDQAKEITWTCFPNTKDLCFHIYSALQFASARWVITIGEHNVLQKLPRTAYDAHSFMKERWSTKLEYRKVLHCPWAEIRKQVTACQLSLKITEFF